MPPRLQEIIKLFENLSEGDRRALLVHYAEGAKKWGPVEGESFDVEDVRKDAECTDTVGIHVRVDPADAAQFRVSLGPQVQTLTRALTSILCDALNGLRPQEIIDLNADFIPRIIGAQLVRQRSQTVYYVLGRIKSALTLWRAREGTR
jgi:cysteine desulfuration protein SufE